VGVQTSPSNPTLGDSYSLVFEDGSFLREVPADRVKQLDHTDASGTYSRELFTALAVGSARAQALQPLRDALEVDTPIEALWGGGEWWEAKVTAVRDNGDAYTILYLDGTVEETTRDKIRPCHPERTAQLLPPLAIGRCVAVRWIGGSFWPACIAEPGGGLFDDGGGDGEGDDDASDEDDDDDDIAGGAAFAGQGDDDIPHYDIRYEDGTPEARVLRTKIRDIKYEGRDALGSIVRVGMPVLVRETLFGGGGGGAAARGDDDGGAAPDADECGWLPARLVAVAHDDATVNGNKNPVLTVAFEGTGDEEVVEFDR